MYLLLSWSAHSFLSHTIPTRQSPRRKDRGARSSYRIMFCLYVSLFWTTMVGWFLKLLLHSNEPVRQEIVCKFFPPLAQNSTNEIMKTNHWISYSMNSFHSDCIILELMFNDNIIFHPWESTDMKSTTMLTFVCWVWFDLHNTPVWFRCTTT